MKLMHLSDLHLGKRVNGFSQIPDQKYILTEILDLAGIQQPDAVLIAGDVYDKSVPSAEAVELFDWFLTELSRLDTDIFIISGNHDSAERIAFGAGLLSSARVYVSPVYDGKIRTITKKDEFGPVHFCLLPFLKPAHVRPYFPEAAIETYSDAIETALQGVVQNPDERYVLLSHQLVTGAERSESEELSIGGTDNIDAEVFKDFDYVALGHLHRPQNVGKNLRYCGTPLKYSFSEAGRSVGIIIEHIVSVAQLALIGHTGQLHLIDPVPALSPACIGKQGIYVELTGFILCKLQRLGDIALLLSLTAGGKL